MQGEAFVGTTDEELDELLDRARYQPDLPHAISARYHEELDAVLLDLQGGRRLLLPRKELQGLDEASVEELSDIQIFGGNDISWPRLDVDHYLPNLLLGRYGSSKWMRFWRTLHAENDPVNTQEAIAELQAFYALEPVLGPCGYLDRQTLQAVSCTSSDEDTTSFHFHFGNKQLIFALGPGGYSLALSVVDEGPFHKDISFESPWASLISRTRPLIWMAMNHHGTVDTLLLSIDSPRPQLSFTANRTSILVQQLNSLP